MTASQDMAAALAADYADHTTRDPKAAARHRRARDWRNALTRLGNRILALTAIGALALAAGATFNHRALYVAGALTAVAYAIAAVCAATARSVERGWKQDAYDWYGLVVDTATTPHTYRLEHPDRIHEHLTRTRALRYPEAG